MSCSGLPESHFIHAHTEHRHIHTHKKNTEQYSPRCLQMSRSSSSERKDHLIGKPSLSLLVHIFTVVLYWTEGEVWACMRVWVCIGPTLKDKNTGGVMIVLLYTCCKNGPGSVYRDEGPRVKTRGKVTEQHRQLFPLLWAFYNIPLSLNELPGDTALNSARWFCHLPFFPQFFKALSECFE